MPGSGQGPLPGVFSVAGNESPAEKKHIILPGGIEWTITGRACPSPAGEG